MHCIGILFNCSADSGQNGSFETKYEANGTVQAECSGTRESGDLTFIVAIDKHFQTDGMI